MGWEEFAFKAIGAQDSPIFISPEFARDLTISVMIFVAGWLTSLRISKRRTRDRIVNALIATHRELVHRAFPTKWIANAKREEWMLEPLTKRLRDVLDSLTEEKKLSRGDLALVDRYVDSVDAFINQWAVTIRRGKSYKERFQESFTALYEVVEMFAPHQVDRLIPLNELAVLASSNVPEAPDVVRDFSVVGDASVG